MSPLTKPYVPPLHSAIVYLVKRLPAAVRAGLLKDRNRKPISVTIVSHSISFQTVQSVKANQGGKEYTADPSTTNW